MKKLRPTEEIFEKLEKNGFHWPEKQYPPARMKDLLKNKFKIDGKKSFNYQEYLKNVKKIGFH